MADRYLESLCFQSLNVKMSKLLIVEKKRYFYGTCSYLELKIILSLNNIDKRCGVNINQTATQWKK